MYDMIIANLIAGTSIIEPEEHMDRESIHIGFSNISSEQKMMKYFMLKRMPDWIEKQLMDRVRAECVLPGVKVNYYMYGQRHTINWDSAEMRNKLSIWERYTQENEDQGTVFQYRGKRDAILARKRITDSTMYLNESELDNKRTLSKATIMIEFQCDRTDEAIGNMEISLRRFKSMMLRDEIRYQELHVNLVDWLQALGPFCLRTIPDVTNKITKKIMTDDLLAMFSSYKQGRIGERGECLGMDVFSKTPVLKQFKDDPDKAENMLIAAETGGGKSYFVKALLTYLLADGFVGTVMDYEGDEYTNLAMYVKAAAPKDVKVISMGKGSTVYFDPLQIPMLTGDKDVDESLKEDAINYTLAIFRLIVGGIEGILNKWEESIVSTAIRRVYENNGVTDEMETWHKSRGLTIALVYDEIVEMVESQEFVDETLDSVKHKAAMEVAESCRIYFEEGEAKASTFKHPMPADELFDAKLIIFSFGMKGATASQTDPVILALKQLSVANISIQVSNYCKYVRHCFNVKIWEEYQRWGEAKGSAEIIGNAMTGGRKRGDANIIITNDLGAILDENNPINSKLKPNIQSYAIGRINAKGIREKFCEEFEMKEMIEPLRLIAKAGGKKGSGKNTSIQTNKYNKAFCLMLDNGNKAIVKVMLPKEIRDSKLFNTGVVIDESNSDR